MSRLEGLSSDCGHLEALYIEPLKSCKFRCKDRSHIADNRRRTKARTSARHRLECITETWKGTMKPRPLARSRLVNELVVVVLTFALLDLTSTLVPTESGKFQQYWPTKLHSFNCKCVSGRLQFSLGTWWNSKWFAFARLKLLQDWPPKAFQFVVHSLD